MLGSGMDPSLIFYHLQAALRRVADGEKYIAQQHEIIASLERNGLDSAPSKTALLRLEELLGLHIAHRDWLQEELANSEPSATEGAVDESRNG
jgi:hypothetical protein